MDQECLLILSLWWWWWLLLYSAILHSQADSLDACLILHEWIAFYSTFLNIHWSSVLTALAWLVPHETAAVSVQVLCTPYNHVSCHFMQSHIRKVYAFSCNLPPALLAEWLGLSRATAVTRGWNGYWNNSQHRSNPEEENSPAAPARIRTCDLSITSLAL